MGGPNSRISLPCIKKMFLFVMVTTSSEMYKKLLYKKYFLSVMLWECILVFCWFEVVCVTNGFQTWWAWSEWWRNWVCQRLICRWRKWSLRWQVTAATPSTTEILWKWCSASDQLFSNCKCVCVSLILHACSFLYRFRYKQMPICRIVRLFPAGVCFDWVQLFLDMSLCVCLILSAHPVQDQHICAIISQ